MTPGPQAPSLRHPGMPQRGPRPEHDKEYGPLLYFAVIAGLTLLAWTAWAIIALIRAADR